MFAIMQICSLIISWDMYLFSQIQLVTSARSPNSITRCKLQYVPSWPCKAIPWLRRKFIALSCTSKAFHQLANNLSAFAFSVLLIGGCWSCCHFITASWWVIESNFVKSFLRVIKPYCCKCVFSPLAKSQHILLFSKPTIKAKYFPPGYTNR